MDKVYVVTAGSYSDYGIVGVFSSKEKAEHYKNLIDDSNDVEEYDLLDDKIITPVYLMSCHYETKDVPYDVGSYSYSEGRLYKQKGKFELRVTISNSLDEVPGGWRMHSTSYSGDSIYLNRTISKYPETDEELEELKDKYKKVCLDFASIIDYEKSIGASDKQINELLSKK